MRAFFLVCLWLAVVLSQWDWRLSESRVYYWGLLARAPFERPPAPDPLLAPPDELLRLTRLQLNTLSAEELRLRSERIRGRDPRFDSLLEAMVAHRDRFQRLLHVGETLPVEETGPSLPEH